MVLDYHMTMLFNREAASDQTKLPRRRENFKWFSCKLSIASFQWGLKDTRKGLLSSKPGSKYLALWVWPWIQTCINLLYNYKKKWTWSKRYLPGDLRGHNQQSPVSIRWKIHHLSRCWSLSWSQTVGNQEFKWNQNSSGNREVNTRWMGECWTWATTWKHKK